MGEDRPALELEFPAAAGDFHDDVRAEDVGGHQVGRELDAVEGEIEHFAERADEQGFAQAGDAFEQDVAAGEHGDQCAFDDFLMADDHLADFVADGGIGLAKGLDLLFCAHSGLVQQIGLKMDWGKEKCGGNGCAG